MNSKVIGLIIVIIIAGITLAGFFVINQENDSSTNTPNQDDINTSQETINNESTSSSEEELTLEEVDFFQGEITEVNSDTNTLVISSEDDGDLTITYTEDTFFESFDSDVESIDMLQEGDKIDGQGIRNDTSVEAEEIFVLFAKEELPEPESGPPESSEQ